MSSSFIQIIRIKLWPSTAESLLIHRRMFFWHERKHYYNIVLVIIWKKLLTKNLNILRTYIITLYLFQQKIKILFKLKYLETGIKWSWVSLSIWIRSRRNVQVTLKTAHFSCSTIRPFRILSIASEHEGRISKCNVV